MKKIAFYIHNPGLKNVDCSGIFDSNPGIGGTEHVMLLVASMLNRMKCKYGVTLFMSEPMDGLQDIRFECVDGIEEAIQRAESNGIGVLTFKYIPEHTQKRALECHSDKLKLVAWVHLFPNRRDLDYYYENSNIKRIVYVGREQRDLYIDHPSMAKSCFIYNTLNTGLKLKRQVGEHPYAERKHVVTYVGSLHVEKGFHLLAQVWKRVLQEVPDAELFVIGSGRVYNRNTKMGHYGLAEDYYEPMFMPYLTNDKGDILPSVHFMGNMGKEKTEILLQTKVGVPNPQGLSETFCISAVEMQLCGIVVVAGQCPGYYDTFINGRMLTDLTLLKDAIVEQLRSDFPVVDYETTYNEIETRFSNERILREWENLLDNIDQHLPGIPNFGNKGYRLKWLKIAVANLKKNFPFMRSMLPVETIFQKLEYQRGKRAY